MKKCVMLTVFMIATFLATATQSSAQDVSGAWKVSFDNPRAERAMTFCVTFAQDGMVLTGNAQPFMGNAESDVCKAQDLANVDLQNVSNGMIHGDHIMFTMTLRSREMAFMGNVDGGSIAGTVNTPRGEIPWIGKRIKD